MKTIFLSLLLAITTVSASAQTDSTVVSQKPQTATTVSQQQTTTPSSQQVALPVKQQQLRFGYLSCDSALHALPAYSIAMKNLGDLKAKYDAEMKRVEDEFNQKYELFLEQQSDFAPSIRQKRQAELQELMEKNTAFKKEAQKLLKDAEKEALTPLKRNLRAAITLIGQQRHLAFVINTDGASLPYADTTMGEDITADVIKAAR